MDFKYLKKFADKETAKKIVIDKNIGKTLNLLLNNSISNSKMMTSNN